MAVEFSLNVTFHLVIITRFLPVIEQIDLCYVPPDDVSEFCQRKRHISFWGCATSADSWIFRNI